MTYNANTVRVASILRRLDPELTAQDAVAVARHVYSPVKVLSRGCDPRPYLSGRVDRLPDHHSWYSLGEVMWLALKIRTRLGI